MEYRESKSAGAGAAAPDVDHSALPLLTTKLYRPPLTPHLEPRVRLIQRLERNRQRLVTLILAPAGYGKTILASMWLESSDCASAWLSLDEGDNDLLTFVRYLLAAVNGTFPDLELKTESLLDAPNLPSVPLLARYLLNDLDQLQEPLTLALDDVHLIAEPAVFELVSQLLRHPPRRLHLMLIGRHTPPLPIASLRAQVQVTEIRAPDLRFTPQETAGLLGRMLDREIDEAVADEWTDKTEGWVAALRLAGLSLRHREPTQDLHASTLGDNRYLKEYLLAEVMAHLPAAHQAWLLKTAVLDRFCAPLCEMVCQTGADRAETCLDGDEFIDWLERENLFLVPLDDRGEWFRLHHLFQSLLQVLLQARLPADEVNALRMAASRWCAENDLIEEALQYALAAGDVDSAVHLVEQHRHSLMNREQWSRLDRWLRWLPEDAVAHSPFLLNARAYLAVYRGHDMEMVSAIQQSERLLAMLSPEAAEVPVVRAEIGVIQAAVDILVGQPAHATATAKTCLEVLPPQALHIRSIAAAIVAVGLQMQGECRQGIEVISEALADRVWPVGLRAKMTHYLAILCFQEGDLTGVQRWAREYLPVAEQRQLGESLSCLRYHLGSAHYLRNEFAQAERYLLALWQDRSTSAPTYLAMGVFALALIYLAQDRLVEAKQAIDRLSAHLQETRDTFALANTEAFRVELALRTGDPAEAHRLKKSIEFDIRPPSWFFYVQQLTAIKLLLAEAPDEGLADADARLAVLEAEMRRINRKNVLIDALSLQALLYDALGDEAVAIEKLREALALGEPGGFIRTFVDLGTPMAELLLCLQDHEAGNGFAKSMHRYVDQILSAVPEKILETAQSRVATGSGPRVSEPTLLEPLTEREYQTLRLLATDLSTEEIAAELFVAKATIYSHSKRIYAKLLVNTRIQAVHRAKELGLL